MKKLLFSFVLLLLCNIHSENIFAQEQTQTQVYQNRPATIEEKRERRQNRVVKEWNTEGRRKWMDRLTVYDPEGRKIEDIEYANYGQKIRIVFEYGEDGKCIKEIEYNDKNKVVRIRKFEHNPDGTKKTQYNYLPNGKLFSTKVFEYSYR